MLYRWGVNLSGGNNSNDPSGAILSNIKSVYSNNSAFAAVDNSLNVYVWGVAEQGGNGFNFPSQPIIGYSSLKLNLSASTDLFGIVAGTKLKTGPNTYTPVENLSMSDNIYTLTGAAYPIKSINYYQISPSKFNIYDIPANTFGTHDAITLTDDSFVYKRPCVYEAMRSGKYDQYRRTDSTPVYIYCVDLGNFFRYDIITESGLAIKSNGEVSKLIVDALLNAYRQKPTFLEYIGDIS